MTLIVKEGIPYVVAVFASALLITLYQHSAWPVGLLLIPVWLLYRDPNRKVPASPLAIVSPMDGQAGPWEDGEDPLLGRPVKRLRIDAGWSSVHVLRAPTEGKLMRLWGHAELAALPGLQTARLAYQVQTDEGDDVLVVLQGASRKNGPRFDFQVGERVGQGQRVGFGLNVQGCELWLSPNSRVDSLAGQAVRAGADTLAHLVH